MPTKTFASFNEALTFGRTYGRENTFPFQTWRVVKAGKRFAVAVFSKNSGALQGWAA